MERKDRNRHGGGVCLYVRDDLSYNRRSDLERDDLEAVWINIYLPKTKPFIVASVYRPQNQTGFTATFDELLKTTDPSVETYILGNINICLLKPKIGLAKSYLSVLNNHGFTQLIDQPTRVADRSSVLDHVICKFSDKVSQSGVVPIGLSDHCMTFCTRTSICETRAGPNRPKLEGVWFLQI